MFSKKRSDHNEIHQTNCQSKVEKAANYTTIPRNQHIISRSNISPNALKVLYRLKNHGYSAYLVGGCIRDLLLGKKPKDFDITTNATPDQIQKIFRNCRLVGRRFRLAHIIFGKEIIEVATFRGGHEEVENRSKEHHPNRTSNISRRSQTGMLLRDNVYGTIEEDALRRDFTLNALYYSVNDFSIRDYCQGLEDLQNGVVRLIGDPETRYREDPVRMLRAIRFAAKLNMQIAPETAEPIRRLAPLLKNIPAARLFDESIKLLQSGNGYATYQLLREYRLFGQLFPTISPLINKQLNPSSKKSGSGQSRSFERNYLEKMVEQVLKNSDARLASGKRINHAFIFTAFFWYPIVELAQLNAMESGLHFNDAFSMAIGDILSDQCKVMAIPRRLTIVMGDIWRLQLQMSKRSGKRVFAILEHPKFRAAYDLLEMRANIEKGELVGLAKWWDEFQSASLDNKNAMVKQLGRSHRSRAKH